MAKPLDPTVKAILDKYKIDPRAALWDCHGTPVMYHRFIEQVAATAGITFDPPQVLEANGAGKSVAIAVVGRMGGRAEWSIGEASPGNCKNTYPYAMAEKRAKDRVTLKMIGLHGFIYSEEEVENGNGAGKPEPEPDAKAHFIQRTREQIAAFGNADTLLTWWNSKEQKDARRFADISQLELDLLKSLVATRRDELTPKKKDAA
jgi:hypothetical protein